MLSLRDENFKLLTTEAEDRGITVQELIRAVIIPDWVKLNPSAKATAMETPRRFAHSTSQQPGTNNPGNGQTTRLTRYVELD